MLRYLVVFFAIAFAACGGGGGGGGGGNNNDAAAGGNHLYIVSQFDRAVDVYDIAADGSFSGPSRTIVGAATGLTNPTSMMVDDQGAVYVVNYQTNVVVFEPGATGT